MSYNDYNRDNRYGSRDRNYKEDGLSFSDSWRQSTVELAAAGAILAGAGIMVATGKGDVLVRAGKDAGKQVINRFDRYLDRALTPTGRFVRNIGKGTYRKLLRMPGVEERKMMIHDPEQYKRDVQTIESQIDMKQVRKKATEQFNNDRGAAIFDHEMNGGDPAKFKFDRSVAEYMERARTDERDRLLLEKKMLAYPDLYKEKKMFAGPNAAQQGGKTPIGLGARFVGSGVTGLGLGAGVTAFHGLDRAAHQWDHDNSQQRAKSFEIAGSFIQGGAKPMDKTADVARHIYDGLAGIAGRVPQAAATGLGYTGVSLGTAMALKNHQDLLANTKHPQINNQQPQQGEAPTGSRIIIELGAPTPQEPLGTFGMVPRVASEEYLGIAKIAGPGQFLNNVFGRPTEMAALNSRLAQHTVNYKDEAAKVLKEHGTTTGQAADQFGHIFPENADRQVESLWNSTADALKQHDEVAKYNLEGEIKRDRLIAGAGASGLGLIAGGIALGNHNKQPGGVSA